jgi:phosphoribosylaminoimidazole-succinocarboxamide synthase
LKLYEKASRFLKEKGIILADTKFEFGFLNGKVVLGDELFTPDSSRFWAMEDYEPGRPQKKF